MKKLLLLIVCAHYTYAFTMESQLQRRQNQQTASLGLQQQQPGVGSHLHELQQETGKKYYVRPLTMLGIVASAEVIGYVGIESLVSEMVEMGVPHISVWRTALHIGYTASLVTFAGIANEFSKKKEKDEPEGQPIAKNMPEL